VARYHESWFDGGDPFRLAPSGDLDLLGADVAAFDLVDAPGVDVTLDQRYPMPDPGAGLVPAVISGAITGVPAEDRVVAIAVDGRVVAVTRTWVGGGGAVEFQAMLPPAAFESSTAPELYLVDGSGSGRTLVSIGG
jgi:hypothetical protein